MHRPRCPPHLLKCLKFYGKHGLILAKAFIPAQKVEDDQVKIEILEGTPGNVTVKMTEADGTTVRYQPETLVEPFESAKGEVVTTRELEDAS